MEVEVHRDLGKHDAQIESLQDQVERLHADMASVLEQLQRINRILAEARGGWKTMLAIGGFASALTAIIIKVWSVFPSLPGGK